MLKPPSFDVDTSDAEVLRMAEQLRFEQRLALCPELAQRDAWSRRPAGSHEREAVWKFFRERGREAPFEVPWHRGLRLFLNLGNELSHAVFVLGSYDANELVFLETMLQPGMHFMDVGANEGLYSLFASRCVGEDGRVWAFEPSSRERATFNRNLEGNSVTNVTVLPFAIAEADGVAELKVANSGRSGHNTLGRPVSDGVSVLRSETVPLRSLDSITAEHRLTRLDFLKLDAEGAELRIVRGAGRVLREFRPTLLFEAHHSALRQQRGTLDDLLAAIRVYDYRILAFDPATGLPTAEPGPDDINLVGIPQERIAA